MPVFMIGLLALAAVFCGCLFAGLTAKGKTTWIKKSTGIAVFILSFISFVISLFSFWNIARYVDEYNASPYQIYGGKASLYMAWFGLGVSFVICAVLGFKLLSEEKNTK
ncbi:MAG: hypothetical protein LBT12_01360 [Oscillospiraceae bacterium]|jgi:Na+-driven multidrug efflux pump|nr:hypothetical protein [Oscillospiraceae bacterium]